MLNNHNIYMGSKVDDLTYPFVLFLEYILGEYLSQLLQHIFILYPPLKR